MAVQVLPKFDCIYGAIEKSGSLPEMSASLRDCPFRFSPSSSILSSFEVAKATTQDMVKVSEIRSQSARFTLKDRADGSEHITGICWLRITHTVVP